MVVARRRRTLSLEEDRERRIRRVSLDDWLAAPPTHYPVLELEQRERIRRLLALDDATVTRLVLDELRDARSFCEDGFRPCPHLRCAHHIGLAGDRSYSCDLDFAEQAPTDERSLERIAQILGADKSNLDKEERRARDKFKAAVAPDALIALGILRRRPDI